MPLSARYMVAPSGLQPMPLEMVNPSSTKTQTAVQVEPVEPARARGLGIGHRAGPEPALRVADPVVHPHVGAPGFRIDQLPQLAVGVEVPEPAAGRQHVATGGGRGNGTDVPADADSCDRTQATAFAQSGAVHLPGQDVDPEQFGPFGVPPRAFAEQSAASRADAHDAYVGTGVAAASGIGGHC